MAVVRIPSLLRNLTGGQATVTANGATVGQVIENLEATFPGTKARLCEGDALRSTLSLIIDGKLCDPTLAQPVSTMSVIHFVPAISGG